MTDEAFAQPLEAMIIGVVLLIAIATTIHTAAPAAPGQAEDAYRDRLTQAREVVDTGQAWCCPRDPSASSLLQDQAMKAWAGYPSPLAETFGPLFPEERTTEFAVKASWASPNGHATHTVDLYRSADSEGKTAGALQLADPANQGPVFVVPRLAATSAEASTDILSVPVDKTWPYAFGSDGAHEDQIRTEITYNRTYADSEEEHAVRLDGHTEVTGTARPATQLQFQEPDWQQLRTDAEDLGLGVRLGEDEMNPTFTQALTTEDLLAERSLHNEDLLDDSEEVDDGEYPQHPFHLQVNISGPDDLGHDPTPTAEGQATRNMTEAYRLIVDVPRNWTDVEISPDKDEPKNENNGWNRTRVVPLDSGGHRITSLLNRTVAFNASGDPSKAPHRWTLNDSDTLQAPFRFHARPPANDTRSELGFHDITATLEGLGFPLHETADLTVEVANSPGRVHRSLDTHAPTHVPATPRVSYHNATGVTVTLGATFENGGEATDVEEIRWTLPQPLNGTRRDLVPLEDFTRGEEKPLADRTDDAFTVSHDGGELTVTWTPGSNPTCDKLDACPVAVNLRLDGHGLTKRSPWAPAQLTTLYDEADRQPYLDWFVRSNDAFDGVPLDRDRQPGFALAHRHTDAEAGPTDNSYRFTVPPTLSPGCKESTFERRNEADRHRRDDVVRYDFGPVEDGLPHLDTACLREDRTFTAIAKMGSRRTTEAIGQHAYRSVPGLSGQTVSSWQNGIAESHLTGPERVDTNTTATFYANLSSLFNELVHDGIGNASLEAAIYDPYNAWEGQAWYRATLAESQGIRYSVNLPKGDFDVTKDERFSTPREPSCESTAAQKACNTKGGKEKFALETDEPLPHRFPIPVEIPEAMIPGTHLLVLEVNWKHTLAHADPTEDERTITETGRLIEPFAVTKDGDPVQDVAVGMTAWDTDWR